MGLFFITDGASTVGNAQSCRLRLFNGKNDERISLFVDGTIESTSVNDTSNPFQHYMCPNKGIVFYFAMSLTIVNIVNSHYLENMLLSVAHCLLMILQ